MLDAKALNVHEKGDITMHGQISTLRCNRETNYKVFTITLPATL